MRLGNMSASRASLSMPSGKGYAFWTWPVLTLAFLDTEYFQMMLENVKNRIKFVTDFSIGQEWESICLTLRKWDFFGNVRPIFLPGMAPMALSNSLSRPGREQWALTGAVSSHLSNSGGVLPLAPNM